MSGSFTAVIGSLVLIAALLTWTTFKDPALGLAALLALLPVLSLTRRLFPEDGYPVVSFETGAALFMWAATRMRLRRDREPAAPMATLTKTVIAVYLGASLVSSLQSRDTLLSLQVFLAGGIVPVLCYQMSRRYIRTRADATKVIVGILLLAIEGAIYTVITFDHRDVLVSASQRFFSHMYNEAPVANLFVAPSATVCALIPAIPLAAWYYQQGGWKTQMFSVAVIAGVVFVSGISLSRGAWLGTLAALLLSLPLLLKRVPVRTMLLIAGVVVILYSSGALDVLGEGMSFRMEQQTISSNSNAARESNYRLALMSGFHHVFVGVGLGRYADIYNEFGSTEAYHLVFAHSLILTLIPEIGLVGALAFLLFVAGPLVVGFRTVGMGGDRTFGQFPYACTAAVVAYLLIASTSGAHIVTYLGADRMSTYFTAPALIVVCSILGILSNIEFEQAAIRKSSGIRVVPQVVPAIPVNLEPS